MQITETSHGTPAFMVDPPLMTRDNGGRQVDWNYVPASFKLGAVKYKASAAAAAGAQLISVEAVVQDLGIGEILDFGKYEPVTVTVNGGGAIATATAIPVAALSGPIPSGTLLDFGPGAGLFAKLSADAAAGATSLAVEALPEAIAAAKTATFTGGNKIARVVAPALEGDTSITVARLPFAIADDDIAAIGGGAKFVPAGTVMCQITNKMVIPRSARLGSEAASGLIISNAREDSRTDAESGYGQFIGGPVYENFLPDAIANGGTLPAQYKTELQALGIGFAYYQYTDSRVA